jgi:hypothetical protein
VSSIPLADAPEFAPQARRTLLVRSALLALAAAAVVAVSLLARAPHSQTVVALPRHSDAIVVLDLSASIGSDTFSRIGATLDSLARSHGRYGLVVFSAGAYEALPPGAPAEDLAPLVRYFIPRQQAAGFAETYPRNPWSDVFSAGTRISSGLELAHQVAVGTGLRRPVVILVSDLDDDPTDLPRLASIVLAYRRDDIPLRIVGLNPSSENAAFFQKLAGPATPIVEAGTATPALRLENHTPFPWTLVALVLAVALTIAAHELWVARLEWEPAQ